MRLRACCRSIFTTATCTLDEHLFTEHKRLGETVGGVSLYSQDGVLVHNLSVPESSTLDSSVHRVLSQCHPLGLQPQAVMCFLAASDVLHDLLKQTFLYPLSSLPDCLLTL